MYVCDKNQPVLQAKEAGCCRLSKDALKRHHREVAQLAQQWDQLVLQHGVLYRKSETLSESQYYCTFSYCSCPQGLTECSITGVAWREDGRPLRRRKDS